MEYIKIREEGAEALAEALKINSSLTVLHLNDNYKIGYKGIKALADALKFNSSLTYLDLRNNFIEKETEALA